MVSQDRPLLWRMTSKHLRRPIRTWLSPYAGRCANEIPTLNRHWWLEADRMVHVPLNMATNAANTRLVNRRN